MLGASYCVRLIQSFSFHCFILLFFAWQCAGEVQVTCTALKMPWHARSWDATSRTGRSQCNDSELDSMVFSVGIKSQEDGLVLAMWNGVCSDEWTRRASPFSRPDMSTMKPLEIKCSSAWSHHFFNVQGIFFHEGWDRWFLVNPWWTSSMRNDIRLNRTFVCWSCSGV